MNWRMTVNRWAEFGLAPGIACIGFNVPVHSAPNHATSYLMEERVSLLDWGMYKLERWLESQEGHYWRKDFGRDVSTYVRYDWDRDRIVIDVQVETKSGNPTKSQCESVLKTVISGGGVAFDTRKRYLNQGVSTFAVEFAQSGYVAGNEPKDLWKRIDDVIELRAIVSNQWPHEEPLRQVECTTKLTEPKVFFSES